MSIYDFYGAADGAEAIMEAKICAENCISADKAPNASHLKKTENFCAYCAMNDRTAQGVAYCLIRTHFMIQRIRSDLWTADDPGTRYAWLFDVCIEVNNRIADAFTIVAPTPADCAVALQWAARMKKSFNAINANDL